MGGLSGNQNKNKKGLGHHADSASSNPVEIPDDVLEAIVDIREYDVPYTTRVAIDLDLRLATALIVMIHQNQKF